MASSQTSLVARCTRCSAAVLKSDVGKYAKNFGEPFGYMCIQVDSGKGPAPSWVCNADGTPKEPPQPMSCVEAAEENANEPEERSRSCFKCDVKFFTSDLAEPHGFAKEAPSGWKCRDDVDCDMRVLAEGSRGGKRRRLASASASRPSTPPPHSTVAATLAPVVAPSQQQQGAELPAEAAAPEELDDDGGESDIGTQAGDEELPAAALPAAELPTAAPAALTPLQELVATKQQRAADDVAMKERVHVEMTARMDVGVRVNSQLAAGLGVGDHVGSKRAREEEASAANAAEGAKGAQAEAGPPAEPAEPPAQPPAEATAEATAVKKEAEGEAAAAAKAAEVEAEKAAAAAKEEAEGEAAAAAKSVEVEAEKAAAAAEAAEVEAEKVAGGKGAQAVSVNKEEPASGGQTMAASASVAARQSALVPTLPPLLEEQQTTPQPTTIDVSEDALDYTCGGYTMFAQHKKWCIDYFPTFPLVYKQRFLPVEDGAAQIWRIPDSVPVGQDSFKVAHDMVAARLQPLNDYTPRDIFQRLTSTEAVRSWRLNP